MKINLIVALGLLLLPSTVLGRGESVAVVYNSKLPASKAVADHYAKLRNVDINQAETWLRPNLGYDD